VEKKDERKGRQNRKENLIPLFPALLSTSKQASSWRKERQKWLAKRKLCIFADPLTFVFICCLLAAASLMSIN